MRGSISETGLDQSVASRLYLGLTTCEIYCAFSISIIRGNAIYGGIYLVYLPPRNFEVHRIFVVSGKKHLELPPVLTDFTNLLVLLVY